MAGQRIAPAAPSASLRTYAEARNMVTSWVRERRLNSTVDTASRTSPDTNTGLTPNLENRINKYDIITLKRIKYLY